MTPATPHPPPASNTTDTKGSFNMPLKHPSLDTPATLPNASEAEAEAAAKLDLRKMIETSVRKALLEMKLGRTTQAEEKPKPEFIAPILSTLHSGLTLREGSGARSEADIVRAQVQVKRSERGPVGSFAREKVRTRLCIALQNSFSVPDYVKVLSPDTDEDIAAMCLDTKATVREFAKWCDSADVSDIFKIPRDTECYSDLRLLGTNTSFFNLITDYKQVSIEDVKMHQAFVNQHAGEEEVESSKWALEVLQLSTDKSLRRRVDQVYENLSVAQQGGIMYFMLLMEAVDKTTDEGMQAMKDWMENFSVKKFAGEDVSKATVHFKTIAGLLGTSVPSDFVKHYLKGMEKASNESFRNTCSNQLGFMGSAMYQDWSKTKGNKMVELDDMSASLLKEYNALTQGLKWAGVKSRASVFNATSDSPSTTTSNIPKSDQEKAEYLRWWDQQKCQLPGCGGNYPTKFHYNLEARYLSDEQQRVLHRGPRARWQNNSNNRSSSNFTKQPKKEEQQRSVRFKSEEEQQRSPRFKSEADKSKFHKLVHKAALATFDEEDYDLVAHLAGDAGTDSGDDFQDSMDDKAVMEAEALVAVCIDNLLNW